MKLALHEPQFNQREQLVVRLHEQEKQSYREIASQLGISSHRVQQIYAGAKRRLNDYAAKGADSLLLLPGRVRTLLCYQEITTRTEARKAIESGELRWDADRESICRKDWALRHGGWKTWVVLNEWVGLPRPTAWKFITCPHCGKKFEL